MSGETKSNIIHHDFNYSKDSGLLVIVLFAAMAAIGVIAFILAIGHTAANNPAKVELSSEAACAVMDDCLLTADTSGIFCYKKNGKEKYNIDLYLSQTEICVGDKYTAVCDLGGTGIALVNKKGLKAKATAANSIISASINKYGWTAVTTEEKKYKALVTVYDDDLTEVYRFHSGTGFADYAVVSPNCDRLTVASRVENDEGSTVTLLVYKLDSEDLYDSVTLSDTTVYNMTYTDNGALLVVGDKQLTILSLEGAVSGYEYSGTELLSYAVSPSGYTALALDDNTGGSILVTVDEKGETLGSLYVADIITKLDAQGKNIAAMSGQRVEAYDQNLTLRGSCTDISDVKDALARKDGRVQLIYDDCTLVYNP